MNYQQPDLFDQDPRLQRPTRFNAVHPDGDKPIIQPKCTFPTYLKSSAWGSHNARDFMGCPYRANKRRLHPEAPEEETHAQKFGTLYHAYVLDRKHFDKSYVEISSMALAEMRERHNKAVRAKAPKSISKNSKVYKEWAAANKGAKLTPDVEAKLIEAFLEKDLIADDVEPHYSTGVYKDWCAEMREKGRIPIKSSTMADVIDMSSELVATPDVIAELSQPAQTEVSIFAPVKGVWVKARPDFIPANDKLIWDLKTARSAHEDDFGRDCETYDYYFQLAWHINVCVAAGIDKEDGGWIVQEKEFPYACALRPADPGRLNLAFRHVDAVMMQIIQAEKNGEFPRYDRTPPTVPKWMESEIKAANAEPEPEF